MDARSCPVYGLFVLALLSSSILASGVAQGASNDAISVAHKGRIDLPGNVHSVAVDGAYAYLVAGMLHVVDVSDPSNPQLVASYDPGCVAFEITLRSNYAFIGGPMCEFQSVDISNPLSPAVGGYCAGVGGTEGAAFADGIAFVAAGNWDVNIVDASDPGGILRLKNIYTTPGSPSGICQANGLVYVADYTGGLHVLDITDPVNPTLLGTVNLPGDALDVVAVDNYAYVAASAGGLQIADISDPTNPVAAGGYITTGSAHNLAVNGSFAYLPTGAAGLQVIGIGRADLPQLRESYDTPGLASGVAVSGDHVYIADGTGLEILSQHITHSGDVNTNGVISSSDIIYLVTHVFKGGPPPLVATWLGDVNCDGATSSADIIGLVSYVFKGGPPPECP